MLPIVTDGYLLLPFVTFQAKIAVLLLQWTKRRGNEKLPGSRVHFLLQKNRTYSERQLRITCPESGAFSMSEIYFTIVGTNHWHGQEFIEPKMQVKLVKEPDNEVDTEAIKVEMPGIGQIGYVANSPYTVVGESYSAGRLYDKIGDEATGTVLYALPRGVLCVLDLSEDGGKRE